MKAKYFKTGLLFAAIAMMFTACDSDRDDNPVLGPANAPTEFVLNASPLLTSTSTSSRTTRSTSLGRSPTILSTPL